MSYEECEKILVGIKAKIENVKESIQSELDTFHKYFKTINNDVDNCNKLLDTLKSRADFKKNVPEIMSRYLNVIVFNIYLFQSFSYLEITSYKHYDDVKTYKDIIRRFGYKKMAQLKLNIFKAMKTIFPDVLNNIVNDNFILKKIKQMDETYNTLLEKFKNFKDMKRNDYVWKREYYESIVTELFWANVLPLVVSTFQLDGSMHVVGIQKIWPNYDELNEKNNDIKKINRFDAVLTPIKPVLMVLQNIEKCTVEVANILNLVQLQTNLHNWYTITNFNLK